MDIVTRRLHSSGLGIMYSDMESKSRIGSVVVGRERTGAVVVVVVSRDVEACRDTEVELRKKVEDGMCDELEDEEVTKFSGTSKTTLGPCVG